MNDVIKQPEYDEPAVTPTTGSHDLAQAYGTLPASRFKSIPRKIPWLVCAPDAVLTTGDSKIYYPIDEYLDGASTIALRGGLSTASSSGAVTVQIRNATQSYDILSTALTIDANETSSHTAATPYVFHVNRTLLRLGDQLYVDVDGAGTGAKGLFVELTVQ